MTRRRRGPLARASRFDLQELRRFAAHSMQWRRDAEAGQYRWQHPVEVLGRIPVFDDTRLEQIVEFRRRALAQLERHPEWERIRSGLELERLRIHGGTAYREGLLRREVEDLRRQVAGLRTAVNTGRNGQP